MFYLIRILRFNHTLLPSIQFDSYQHQTSAYATPSRPINPQERLIAWFVKRLGRSLAVHFLRPLHCAPAKIPSISVLNIAPFSPPSRAFRPLPASLDMPDGGQGVHDRATAASRRDRPRPRCEGRTRVGLAGECAGIPCDYAGRGARAVGRVGAGHVERGLRRRRNVRTRPRRRPHAR